MSNYMSISNSTGTHTVLEENAPIPLAQSLQMSNIHTEFVNSTNLTECINSIRTNIPTLRAGHKMPIKVIDAVNERQYNQNDQYVVITLSGNNTITDIYLSVRYR